MLLNRGLNCINCVLNLRILALDTFRLLIENIHVLKLNDDYAAKQYCYDSMNTCLCFHLHDTVLALYKVWFCVCLSFHLSVTGHGSVKMAE